VGRAVALGGWVVAGAVVGGFVVGGAVLDWSSDGSVVGVWVAVGVRVGSSVGVGSAVGVGSSVGSLWKSGAGARSRFTYAGSGKFSTG
jgi:hypothetical protein